MKRPINEGRKDGWDDDRLDARIGGGSSNRFEEEEI